MITLKKVYENGKKTFEVEVRIPAINRNIVCNSISEADAVISEITEILDNNNMNYSVFEGIHNSKELNQKEGKK